MIAPSHIDTLDPTQLRQALHSLMAEVAVKDELIERHQRESAFKQAIIDKLTHEMAVLKRLKFAAKSEAFNAEQNSLIEEAIDADLAALAKELESLRREKKTPEDKQQPKREKLPANLPRREIHHEPESTTCSCGCALKRIGEDVAEKLDYAPGVFTVERHVRGKWVCAKCETLVQAPVAPHIIDKGIPTAGLLAQVLVAKFLDHLPLYRQERIFERAGLAIADKPRLRCDIYRLAAAIGTLPLWPMRLNRRSRVGALNARQYGLINRNRPTLFLRDACTRRVASPSHRAFRLGLLHCAPWASSRGPYRSQAAHRHLVRTTSRCGTPVQANP